MAIKIVAIIMVVIVALTLIWGLSEINRIDRELDKYKLMIDLVNENYSTITNLVDTCYNDLEKYSEKIGVNTKAILEAAEAFKALNKTLKEIKNE